MPLVATGVIAGITFGPSPAGATSGSSINVAVINESSGEFGEQFAPIVPGVEAWASWENAHGGIDGHHIDLKTYDSASNPSTAVSNAHLAVDQGAQAIIDTDPLFDSYAPYLTSVGVPVYAFGITPGFYKPDTDFFSYSGNVTTGKSTASIKFLVDKEHKTKFAAIADPSPADSGDVGAEIPLIKQLGGDVVYSNLSVDPTNTASLLSVAQAIKASGAQVVESAAGGTEAQFQADLAQVGAGNIWVVDGSDFQQNLPEQFGAALDNYTFFFYTAPFADPSPGMKTYLSAMKKYQPADEYNFNSLVGWASASMLQGAIEKIGSGSVTMQSLDKASNSLTNFTGDGVIAPISFPAYHTESTNCFAFEQVQKQKWVLLSGTNTNPFYCSAPLP